MLEENRVSVEELKTLDAFFNRPDINNVNTEMNIFSLHGLFAAMASSPVEILGRAWVPLVFNVERDKRKKAAFLNNEESKTIMAILHRLIDDVAEDLKNNRFAPLLSVEQEKVDLNLESSWGNLQSWCAGYMYLVHCYNRNWSVVPDIFIPLYPLSLLAGNRTLLKQFDRKEDLNAEIRHCILSLPESIREVYRFWKENKYADIVKSQIKDRFLELYKKQNELCACGSNLKQMVCCDRKKLRELALGSISSRFGSSPSSGRLKFC